MGRPKDLTGQRFGHLTVIELAGVSGTFRLWRCKCDCGNETVVRSSNLLMRRTTSCGCIRGRKYTDLTGEEFGLLTALEPVGSVRGSKLWRCKCKCGEEVVVYSRNLISGNTQSCGCLRRLINS